MFCIRDGIFQIPFYFFAERMLPDSTIGFYTNGTTAADTIVCMNEKFHRGAKFFFN
jgi:hypothetical protein